MEDLQFRDLWSESQLDKLRFQTDPEFDQIAQEIFDPVLTGEVGLEEFKKQMRDMAQLDFSRSASMLEDLSQPMQKLFVKVKEFSFSEKEKTILHQASVFFEKYGPLMLMSLFFRSLLKQYAATYAAEILVKTNLLTEFPDRRIKETMQFVLDVMNPENYVEISPEDPWQKPALYSIGKLRLVHSMVRIRIKNPEILLKKNEHQKGEPINQEDMILAIQSFSIETIEGLRSFGLELNKAEMENFFQAWKIIGEKLGVRYPEGLAPLNYGQGLALQKKIYSHQFIKPNPNGAHLARTTLEWIDEITTGLPFKNEDTINQLLKAFNGPENYSILRDNLQIDLGPEERLVPELDRGFLEELFHEMIKSILQDSRGGKTRGFRLYDGFAVSWNIRGSDNYQKQTPLEMFWSAVKAFFRTLWNRIKSWFFKN